MDFFVLEIQTDLLGNHINLQALPDVFCKSSQTEKESCPCTEDKSLCTGGNMLSKDHTSQVSTLKDTVNTQTFRKTLVDNGIQYGLAKSHVSLQVATETAPPIGIQTKPLVSEDKGIELRDCFCPCSKNDNKEVSSETRDQVLKANEARSTQTIFNDPSLRSAKPPPSQSVGVQVFPSFQTVGSQSSNTQLHKDVQVDLRKKSVEAIVKQDEPSDSKLFVNPDKVKVVDQGTQYLDEVGKDATIANSSATTTLTNTTSSSSSRVTCSYCKEKAFLAEVTYLPSGSEYLTICSRCYYYSRPRICNHSPKFVCRCFNHWHPQQNTGSLQYCRCCGMEVSKCPRRPKGLLYTVILPDAKEGDRRSKSTKNSLENIKVEKGWSKKSWKEKENYFKREDYRNNSLDKLEKKNATSDNRDNGDKDTLRKKSRRKKKGEALARDDNGQYTLMEYLIQNRPEFIYSAEYRRQMLLNSRILRERQRDNLKLHFLDNNLKPFNDDKYKLFNEREMKDINKKTYQKLPEVQNKLVNQRERRLRIADRLLSSFFAKKVQKSILKGKGNFPIDRPVTNL